MVTGTAAVIGVFLLTEQSSEYTVNHFPTTCIRCAVSVHQSMGRHGFGAGQRGHPAQVPRTRSRAQVQLQDDTTWIMSRFERCPADLPCVLCCRRAACGITLCRAPVLARVSVLPHGSALGRGEYRGTPACIGPVPERSCVDSRAQSLSDAMDGQMYCRFHTPLLRLIRSALQHWPMKLIHVHPHHKKCGHPTG